MGYIGDVTIGSTNYPIGSTLYGTCSTQAITAEKVVVMSNFDKLKTGITIHVKFDHGNTAWNPTLNVNNTGAKTVAASGFYPTISWDPLQVYSFTYDGSAWKMNGLDRGGLLYGKIINVSTTSDNNSEKKNCYTSCPIAANSYYIFVIPISNSYEGTIKIRVANFQHSTTAYCDDIPVYINGTVSSSTNCTLPANTYFVYYDGTNFYFQTDGDIYTGTSISQADINAAFIDYT